MDPLWTKLNADQKGNIIIKLNCQLFNYFYKAFTGYESKSFICYPVQGVQVVTEIKYNFNLVS